MTSFLEPGPDAFRLIAVDIGNTACKFAYYCYPNFAEITVPGTPFFYPFSIADIRLIDKNLKILPYWLAKFYRSPEGEDDRFTWGISSVNHEKLEKMTQIIHKTRPMDSIRLITQEDIPLKNAYDTPQRLGMDRLLAGYAAKNYFQTDGPVLIVDIGTALKVDLIDASGAFAGGVILPGPETQIRSLGGAADQLPNLHWSEKKTPIPYPATETQNAIQLGVRGGICGTVLYFYREALQKTGCSSIPMMITGGGLIGMEPLVREMFENFFAHSREHIPTAIQSSRDLVLSGIALAFLNRGENFSAS